MPGSSQSWSRGAVAVLLAAVALAVVLVTGERSGRTQPAQARATVTLRSGTVTLPRSYFGLSIEYPELPMFERYRPAFERFLSLLAIRGDGPQLIRIGGDSADMTYWHPGTALPTPSFTLTDGWFAGTSALVRALRLRLLLDLRLLHSTPSQAAAEAEAALARLPRSSIAGFEIGNEPDHYGHGYSISDYVAAFRADHRAVARVASGLPMMGPAISRASTDDSWLAGLIAGARSELGVVTGHRYPLSACAHPGDRNYPTVPRLLSESVTAGLAQSVLPAVRLAHDAGRPFRLDELNSVTCGGRPGVSDTFATALWAPDALFELLQTGLDGVNVHIRSTKVNGPLAVAAHGLAPRPLLYGLILFARTLSPGGRLVPLSVSVPASIDLKVWAARVSGNVLHVLLIDKSSRGVTVDLRLSASATASLERLLAPSVRARIGVTLAGRQLGRDGRWTGLPETETVAHGADGYQLSVPGFSAALLSVKLR